jgi:hypothetical protein
VIGAKILGGGELLLVAPEGNDGRTPPPSNLAYWTAWLPRPPTPKTANTRSGPTFTSSCGDFVLHRDLGLETFKVAEDRSHRTQATILLKTENAVFLHNVALDLDLIP